VRLPGGGHRWIMLRSIDRDGDRWLGRGDTYLGKGCQGLGLNKGKRALMSCHIRLGKQVFQGKVRDVLNLQYRVQYMHLLYTLDLGLDELRHLDIL